MATLPIARTPNFNSPPQEGAVVKKATANIAHVDGYRIDVSSLGVPATQEPQQIDLSIFPPGDFYVAGNDALYLGEPLVGEALLYLAAEAGYKPAMFQLGKMYELGYISAGGDQQSCPRNWPMARKYYERLAAGSNAAFYKYEAKARLELMADRGENPQDVIAYRSENSALFYEKAMAFTDNQGDGRKVDLTTLILAANLQNPDAEFMLGKIYFSDLMLVSFFSKTPIAQLTKFYAGQLINRAAQKGVSGAAYLAGQIAEKNGQVETAKKHYEHAFYHEMSWEAGERLEQMGEEIPGVFRRVRRSLDDSERLADCIQGFANKSGSERALKDCRIAKVYLLTALSHEDMSVRYWAEIGLGRIGAEVIPDLLVKLKHPDAQTRASAAMAMRHVGYYGLIEHPEVFQVLFEMLNQEGDEEVINNVLSAIEIFRGLARPAEARVRALSSNENHEYWANSILRNIERYSD